MRTAAHYGINEPNLDSFTQFDIGLALSGPVRKDRAWFYASYNPIVDDRTASFPGMTPTRDRLRQHRFAAKVTWQPQPVTRLSVTFTGDPSRHDAVTPGDFSASRLGTQSGRRPGPAPGRWRQPLTQRQPRRHSRLLLEASLSRSLFRKDRLPETDLGASVPYFVDLRTRVRSGGFGGSDREHLGRTALRLSGTRAGRAPHVKLGLEYESTSFQAGWTRGGTRSGAASMCSARPETSSTSGTGPESVKRRQPRLLRIRLRIPG